MGESGRNSPHPIFANFCSGIGIGGDYPVSSVITSEFAARKIRGRMMAAVFSAQGWGNCEHNRSVQSFSSLITFLVTCAIVAVIVVAAYKDSIHSQPLDDLKSVDQAWRLIIGIGCVPAVIALYFRLTIPETPRYTMDVERNIKQASQDVDAYITTGQYIADPVQINDRAEVPKASWSDFIRHFGQWQNGKVLLGTSWSWFALDIAFYGLGKVAASCTMLC